jgi:hypothetical protein
MAARRLRCGRGEKRVGSLNWIPGLGRVELDGSGFRRWPLSRQRRWSNVRRTLARESTVNVMRPSAVP